MPTTVKHKPETVDYLLRQHDEPPRKKRRLSVTESMSEDQDSVSSSGDEEEGSAEENIEDDDASDIDSEPQDYSAPSQLNVEDRLSLFGQRLTSPKPNVATSPAPPPVASFASLGISRPLQSALNSMSIKAPTEVQSACIPVLLAGKYVLL